MPIIYYMFCAVIGYLMGCFTTAVIVSQIFKRRDIRNYGSGNAGTSNMIRTFGVGMGILTFAGDAAKGALAAFIGTLVAGELGGYIAAAFAIIGHNWPVFASFRGGKGMATSIGIVLFFTPFLGLGLLGFAALIIALTSYFSVGSMAACVVFPVSILIFYPQNIQLLVFSIFVGVLGIFSHRENIGRIIKGTENKTDLSKFKSGKLIRKK